MTDRPILFSAPMVLALLAGRKTQTRRIIKPHPFLHEGWEESGIGVEDGRLRIGRVITHQRIPITVGDRLWVRETLRFDWPTNNWRYDADKAICCEVVGTELETPTPIRWPLCVCVSIHMPRVLSRLTLTVTDVRVQRLLEIRETDALAEGVVNLGHTDGEPWDHFEIPETRFRSSSSAIVCFDSLWCSINGEDAWAANPWVAAYTFSVEQKNIDE